MISRRLVAAALCLTFSETTACSCTGSTDYIRLTPYQVALFVGDKVTAVAVAESNHEFCGGDHRSSTEDPSAYALTTGNAAVATVSERGEITAVGAGTTFVRVTHQGYTNPMAAYLSVARPIARLEFLVTPASPKVGDTVTVVTNAIDQQGAVTPGAFFSGLQVQSAPVAGGTNATQVVPFLPERIRFVINSAGRYTVRNSAMRQGNVAASVELAIDVP
jgi:hypothetical protein